LKYTAAIEKQAQRCQVMLAETTVCLEATQFELAEAKQKHKAEVARLVEVEWCARRCASQFQQDANKTKFKVKSMRRMHRISTLESEKAEEDLKTKLVSQVCVV